MVEGGDPEGLSIRLAEILYLMRSIPTDSESQKRERVLHALLELDSVGRDLAETFERLYVNVQDALTIISERSKRWPELQSDAISVRTFVADDQPGILFGLEDLALSVGAILENAAMFLRQKSARENGQEKFWIDMRFGWSADRQSGTLTVRDNIPYDNPAVPAGGLRQAIDCCKKYGVYFDLDCKDESDLHLKMRFQFRVDRSRRG
jgi:hypothetical protein